MLNTFRGTMLKANLAICYLHGFLLLLTSFSILEHSYYVAEDWFQFVMAIFMLLLMIGLFGDFLCNPNDDYYRDYKYVYYYRKMRLYMYLYTLICNVIYVALLFISPRRKNNMEVLKYVIIVPLSQMMLEVAIALCGDDCF